MVIEPAEPTFAPTRYEAALTQLAEIPRDGHLCVRNGIRYAEIFGYELELLWVEPFHRLSLNSWTWRAHSRESESSPEAQ